MAEIPQLEMYILIPRIGKLSTTQFHKYEASKIAKLIKSKTGMVVTRGWRGWGDGELLINRPKVSVKMNEH